MTQQPPPSMPGRMPNPTDALLAELRHHTELLHRIVELITAQNEAVDALAQAQTQSEFSVAGLAPVTDEDDSPFIGSGGTNSAP